MLWPVKFFLDVVGRKGVTRTLYKTVYSPLPIFTYNTLSSDTEVRHRILQVWTVRDRGERRDYAWKGGVYVYTYIYVYIVIIPTTETQI